MNESSPQIESKIIHYIAEHSAIDPGSVEVDENILTSGLVDSVGMMRLITHLEHELGVTVPPPDLVPENFRTVRVMAAYLGTLQAG